MKALLIWLDVFFILPYRLVDEPVAAYLLGTAALALLAAVMGVCTLNLALRLHGKRLEKYQNDMQHYNALGRNRPAGRQQGNFQSRQPSGPRSLRLLLLLERRAVCGIPLACAPHPGLDAAAFWRDQPRSAFLPAPLRQQTGHGFLVSYPLYSSAHALHPRLASPALQPPRAGTARAAGLKKEIFCWGGIEMLWWRGRELL